MNQIVRQLMDLNELLDHSKPIPKQLIELAKRDKIIKVNVKILYR